MCVEGHKILIVNIIQLYRGTMLLFVRQVVWVEDGMRGIYYQFFIFFFDSTNF